ncbi:WD40-repeat-containing domain protein [Aspergillus pseudonomiae]|nr:WD40-repeat-containing domain protein [Aspergillus pseudonomiae]
MLVCGIIDELRKSISSSNSSSFFFFQAADSRINNATSVVRCLIRQLVDQHPSLISHLRKYYDQYEDAISWYTLSRVFTDILEDQTMPRTFLVIDGLDECQAGLSDLLHKIMQDWSLYSHVKWLVSSRNWPSIRERLGTAEQLSLELNAESVSTAVGLYIDYKARELATRKEYNDQTQRAVQQYLATNADGTFLWVALVCFYLENVQWDPIAKMKTFPPGLDSLYRRMMQEIRESGEDVLCWEILGFMVTAYRPMKLKELASLSEVLADHSNDPEALEKAMSLCGSFLTVREGTVYFVHQSAKDFLSGKASDELFPSGIELVHHTIFSKSLSKMELALRRDIYSLHNPGFPIDKVKRPQPDPLGAMRYLCIYWIDHLHDSRHIAAQEHSQTCDKIYDFLSNKYLNWLEALSLLQSITQGVRSVSKLEDLVQKKWPGCSNLINLVHDAHRFIRYFKRAIEISPLQVYWSALMFSPACSIIRQRYEDQQPQCFLSRPAMEENWSACLQTLEGHTWWVTSVVFSGDSKMVASASGDATIKIWDVNSGYCLQTLEGHTDIVRSVVFSGDSKIVASASHDKTIKIWDINSGQCLQTLEGHTDIVRSVVFSGNSKIVASASHDKTVKIWDINSGQCLQTLEGHSDPVKSVVFSGNSKMVASASGDDTVKIWDINSGHYLQTLEGHSNSVFSAVFSGDSKIVASASIDRTVKVWDISSSHCLQTLEGHSNSVISAVISGDLKMVASASHDGTVKIWDITSGHCLQTLEGHSNSVISAVFSGDSKIVASASYDCTVKVWDVTSGHCLQTVYAGSVVEVKSFDPTNCYLELNSGAIHLSFESCTTPVEPTPEAPTFQGCGISPDRVWITSDAANLLWLPPEYRPRAFDATQSSICLGCPTGRVLIFGLDF